MDCFHTNLNLYFPGINKTRLTNNFALDPIMVAQLFPPIVFPL